MTKPTGAILILGIGAQAALVHAQNAPPAAGDGSALFAEHCAACHGRDARGTSMGPELAGNRRLRSRSAQQIAGVIRDGIPAAGMPAFNLAGTQMEALSAFVHAMNSPASGVAIAGDRASGERFFFGEGRCASCHMVNGRGKPIGPDMSGIAREMTVDELRESLLRPDARISLGYGLVTVALRNGQMVRGFARSRSNFDVALQDLTGLLRPVHEHEIASIREESHSY